MIDKELQIRKKIVKLNKKILELEKQRDLEIEYLYKILDEKKKPS